MVAYRSGGGYCPIVILHNYSAMSIDNPEPRNIDMTKARQSAWFFGLWSVLAVVLGSVLMSYHQPFVQPSDGVLSLAGPGDGIHWRAVHLLSGSCGCSQVVMKHLLKRGPLSEVAEQVIVVDGAEAYLPGGAELIRALKTRGFAVSHLSTRDVPAQAGLRGVPLLVYARPDGRPAYVGGYGMSADGDQAIYRQVRAGGKPRPLPVLGCAVGAVLRHTVDPFGLKYR